MAAGEVDLMGSTSTEQFAALLAAANELGLGPQLARAMERAQPMPVVL